MGCGQSAPKHGLLRFVLREGRLEADPDARLPGRGAYLHHDEACAREAVRRRGFERSLRTTVRLPDDLLESLS
ncbi:MAG: YlxR family protein [Actinobacteria bacterium]|nr:MAG: YlxR family protein [Actinomycetota bacterium]TML82887.1 MAG: YlxR family protein [Actinomycetota bacterium]